MNIVNLLKESKVIHNFGWLSADKIIRLLGGLVVGAWVARYLGPERYGLINFVTAFSALFTSFSMLGIDNIVIRELASKKYDVCEVLGTAIRIRNIGSVVAAVLAIAIGGYLYATENIRMYFSRISLHRWIYSYAIWNCLCVI